MGIVHPGPPKELVSRLVNTYCITCFVETGTYAAETAYWASQHFREVWTIEAAEQLYYKAKDKYQHITNIHFVLGDSRKELKEIAQGLHQPALFWLDSHWSGDETYGIEEECPLIEEIRIILSSEASHFIFIDDARLFLSPPPEPHKMAMWPTITQVIETLSLGKDGPYVAIIEDVIVAVPKDAKLIVASYCREVNTLAWREYTRAGNLHSVPLRWKWWGRFSSFFK